MNARSPPGIARFDSAAAMVQAVAAFLHGRDVASLSGSPLLDRTMPLVNYLPRRAREWVYSIGGMTDAVSQREVGKLNFDDIAEWITSRLPKRSYPGVFIGSSNGALVQVSCLLGGVDHPLPLGTMDEARPICNACTARTVWRADEE